MNKKLSKQDGGRKSAATIFIKWLETGGELFSSLLFPPRCPVCDEILAQEEAEKGIHLACESKLFPVEGAVCMHCGRPLGQSNSRKIKLQREKDGEGKSFENEEFIPIHLRLESTYEYCPECLRKGYASVSNFYMQGNRPSGDQSNSYIVQGKSLYLYKGAIKKTMYRLKYANKREYARFFAKQAVKKYGAWLRDTAGIDVIIPVPMYLPKQKQRGYNQAEIFAVELSRLTGIPVDKDYIRRVKDTTPQKNLNDMERKNNLENAFQTGENIVQYKHILVVDDIYTTGCTAEAVARELRKQGDCHIYVLSICIGGSD